MRLQMDFAYAGSFFDTNFAKTVLGYAYRPDDNDKFNVLLEYKFLYDQAPSDQFTASGQQNEFE